MKTTPAATKTNAARLLDSLAIPYQLQAYEVDPEDLTAISVARKIGLPPEQVFKTLLAHTNSGEHLFAVIPGDAELDLKKLAHAAGAKKAELASLKEVEPLTGYIRGGVTVMAARKPFPAYADETIELHDLISVSAGQRGLQILLNPADYLRATEATIADLTKLNQQPATNNQQPAPMTYFHHVLGHLRKDLRLEWRGRDAINAMLFFSLLVVAIFSLAFDPTGYPTTTRQIAGGVLWVAILFSSVTALNQSWTREQRNQVLDAQRLAPSPASALFLGKALANMVFVTAVEAILAPIFIIFYNLHALGNVALLALILPLGTWALIVNGTFFAALGLRARSRELLLPLLLFPISIPALLAMVQATSGIITNDLDPIQINLWIKQLAAYDLIYTTLCILLFETILHAE